jgi:DNA-binding YbaB/EbfC family protein
MPEMQARLGSTTYTADSGGGVVKATVNGKLGLVDIKIDPSVLADSDAQMLEDLIKAAVSSAQAQAAKAAEEAMREITGGMELPGLF